MTKRYLLFGGREEIGLCRDEGWKSFRGDFESLDAAYQFAVDNCYWFHIVNLETKKYEAVSDWSNYPANKGSHVHTD